MSDFNSLQAVIAKQNTDRKANAKACEEFLNMLYQAFRRSNGHGQPLNNVSFEIIDDPKISLRPLPVGGFYAAWFRLGLCEVLIRVSYKNGEFSGEFANGCFFAISEVSSETCLGLTRKILKDLLRAYSDSKESASAPMN